MRRVFLIGLVTGVILFWMKELDPQSMLLDIVVWLLFKDQKTPLPPNPALFLYLLSMQMTLILLYGVIATKLKVNNHFDMLICGISTGIFLKWFASLGEKELLAGVMLFILGYPTHIFLTHGKEGRFAAIRGVLLTITISMILWLVGSVFYNESNRWIAISGATIALLGAFTEINGIRPLGALTLQTLPKRIMVAIQHLLDGKPSGVLPTMVTMTEKKVKPAKKKKRVRRKRGRAKKRPSPSTSAP